MNWNLFSYIPKQAVARIHRFLNCIIATFILSEAILSVFEVHSTICVAGRINKLKTLVPKTKHPKKTNTCAKYLRETARIFFAQVY